MKSLTTIRHVGGGLFYGLAALGAVRMSRPRDEHSAVARLADSLAAIAIAHDVSPTVVGELPRVPSLIQARPVSYLDPIAVLPIVPSVPVVRDEIASWPIVGAIGEHYGVMFASRCDPQGRIRNLQRIRALLANGISVLDVSGIEAGQVDAPVVPLVIRYTDPSVAWEGGPAWSHYAGVAGRRRIEVTLEFGTPRVHAMRSGSARTGDVPGAPRPAMARALASLAGGPTPSSPRTGRMRALARWSPRR